MILQSAVPDSQRNNRWRDVVTSTNFMNRLNKRESFKAVFGQRSLRGKIDLNDTLRGEMGAAGQAPSEHDAKPDSDAKCDAEVRRRRGKFVDKTPARLGTNFLEPTLSSWMSGKSARRGPGARPEPLLHHFRAVRFHVGDDLPVVFLRRREENPQTCLCYESLIMAAEYATVGSDPVRVFYEVPATPTAVMFVISVLLVISILLVSVLLNAVQRTFTTIESEGWAYDRDMGMFAHAETRESAACARGFIDVHSC